MPLKIEIDKYQTLINLIEAITNQRKMVKDHQWYPLTEIIIDQRKLRKEFDTKFFNVGVVETNLNAKPMILDNLTAETVDIAWNNQSIYQICLQYDSSAPTVIKFRLEYQKNSIDSILINKFMALLNFKWVSMLYSLLKNPTYRLLNMQLF